MLWLLLIVAAISLTYGGIPPSGDLFFEFTGGEVTFPFNCDDCSATVFLEDTYYFFGKPYNKVYVNSNGFLSFDYSVYWYDPWPTDAFWGPPMIAPLWEDNDLSLGVTAASVKWEETTSNNRLQRAKGVAKKKFPNCPTKFVPTSVFIVTWEDVPSYCEWGFPSDRKRDVSGDVSGDVSRDVSGDVSGDVSDIQGDKASEGEMKKREAPNSPSVETLVVEVNIAHNPDKPSPQVAQQARENFTAANDSVSKRTADDPWGFTYYVNSYQVVLATDGYNTFAIVHFLNPLEWSHCWDYNKLLFNAGDCCGFYMEPNNGGDMTMYDSGSNVNRKARFAYRIDGHNDDDSNHIVAPFCEEVGTPADDFCDYDDYYYDYYQCSYYAYY